MAFLPPGLAFPGLPAAGSGKAGKAPPACFATGGERGVVRLWRADTAKCVYEQPASAAVASAAAGGIVELALLPGGVGLLTATQDCRLLFHRPAGGQLAVDRQLIGNNDEVTDIRFLTLPAGAGSASGAADGGADAAAAAAGGEQQQGAAAAAAAALPTHLAVSTNSDQIRIFDAASLACTATLAGHTDTVLALDALRLPSGATLLASGSKDASLRLWSLPDARCVGACQGGAGRGGAGRGGVPGLLGLGGTQRCWHACGRLQAAAGAADVAHTRGTRSRMLSQLCPRRLLLSPCFPCHPQEWARATCPRSAAWPLRAAAAALWPAAAPTSCSKWASGELGCAAGAGAGRPAGLPACWCPLRGGVGARLPPLPCGPHQPPAQVPAEWSILLRPAPLRPQVWDIKSLDPAAAGAGGKPAKLRVTAAVAAHDKDINAVAVAPNDSGKRPCACVAVMAETAGGA